MTAKALKPIMIEKDTEVLCLQNISAGTHSFTKGLKYKSPEDNCLIENGGEEVFITPNYLKYFEL